MKYLKYVFASLFGILGLSLYSQIPTDVPKPTSSPVDFSEPVNIILFIVLPVFIIVFAIMWRNKERKDKN